MTLFAEMPPKDTALEFRHTRNDDFVVVSDGNGGEELLTPYEVQQGIWPPKVGTRVVRQVADPVVDIK